MKIKIILFSLFCAGCNLTTQSQQVTDSDYAIMLQGLLSHSVPEISVSDTTNQKGAIFLDAREMNEYEVSHLPNSIWVGYNDFDAERLKQLDPSKKIIVYCAVGYRSEKIAETLITTGYKNVSNLYGGIFEWVNEGKAVVDNKGNSTTRIHAYNENWAKWLHKGIKVY